MSSGECFVGSETRDKVSGTCSGDLPDQESIPCSGDDLCHPLTIYKGFLVCSSLNDAFFLPGPGETPVSTWVILPPMSIDAQESLKLSESSAAPQNCPIPSNQHLLERLKSELSPEGIAKLLESQAAQAQYLPNQPSTASGSKKRKNFLPYKSPSPDDPNFSGVQVKMNYKLRAGKLDFSMAHKFCNVSKESKKTTLPCVAPVCGSQSGNDTKIPRVRIPQTKQHNWKSHYAGKECASCGVRKTPLWRDAEDGTPLCNACGIRYKKYRIRCSRCWNIPRRGLKPTWKCIRCGKIF